MKNAYLQYLCFPSVICTKISSEFVQSTPFISKQIKIFCNAPHFEKKTKQYLSKLLGFTIPVWVFISISLRFHVISWLLLLLHIFPSCCRIESDVGCSAGAHAGGGTMPWPPLWPNCSSATKKKCTENDIKKSHCLTVLQLKCQDDDDGRGRKYQ